MPDFVVPREKNEGHPDGNATRKCVCAMITIFKYLWYKLSHPAITVVVSHIFALFWRCEIHSSPLQPSQLASRKYQVTTIKGVVVHSWLKVALNSNSSFLAFHSLLLKGPKKAFLRWLATIIMLKPLLSGPYCVKGWLRKNAFRYMVFHLITSLAFHSHTN